MARSIFRLLDRNSQNRAAPGLPPEPHARSSDFTDDMRDEYEQRKPTGIFGGLVSLHHRDEPRG